MDASTAQKVHIFYGTLPPLSDEPRFQRWLHSPYLGYNPRPFFESIVRRFPMTNQAAEVAKRRTFAIISHPDITL